MLCDELDDDLVEVARLHVEPDYMVQNFHKMVNFEVKTNAENKIAKKISFRRKKSINADIFIENMPNNIEMRRLLNWQCQHDNHEERLIYWEGLYAGKFRNSERRLALLTEHNSS